MDNLGKKLREIRKNMGKTQEELAQLLTIPQTTWSNYEVGKANPPLKILVKLSEMGYPITGLTGKGHPELNTELTPVENNKKVELEMLEEKGYLIPLLNQKVSAGKGEELLNEEETRMVRVPSEVAKIPDLAALKVKGDSMYPTLSDGDLIVCDKGGFQGDGIYVIRTSEYEYVKRLILTPAGFNVISDNPQYPAYLCTNEDSTVIGKVRCAVIKW